MLNHFYISVTHLHRNSSMMKILLMVALILFVMQIILFVIFENYIHLFNINCFRFIVLACMAANCGY